MTYITDTKSPSNDIIGPFSYWPRRRNRRRTFGLAAAASGLAVFVHCGLPLIG